LTIQNSLDCLSTTNISDLSDLPEVAMILLEIINAKEPNSRSFITIITIIEPEITNIKKPKLDISDKECITNKI
ncbi:17742_t:CDS:1, partial [Cetraspora pellucida]